MKPFPGGKIPLIPVPESEGCPPPQAIIEQGLKETIRETIPNPDQIRGTFVVFCFQDSIEVKARGLSPRQIIRILGILIGKLF